MTLKKVYIVLHDPFLYKVYDEDETKATFGEGFLEQYGKEIPVELLIKYKSSHQKFWDIQREIEQYLLK